MTLNEFYNEVARRTDTAKTKINAAETRRVISEAFVLLSGMSAADSSALVAKALAAGAKKSAPKKKKK
ncbi:hypothetical protein Pla123a_25540 [Posidoniimonas polymericola]|uniref:Uncharacterized protein n=1 Tax=Posidoniimonas polymericola TaxID=2528002 RepID=A0A5C5YQI0_9BACT|nr:hypothetical protein [Posidoniimonas polymericola]TWT77123.1 hypothetical protein Pla123a_25540 [Posidoniimonas polymericola]